MKKEDLAGKQPDVTGPCQKPHQVQDSHGTLGAKNPGLSGLAPSKEKIGLPPSQGQKFGLLV